MRARKLVYASRNPSESLRSRLAARGWHVEVVAGANEVRRSLRRDVAMGGLLDLSSGFDPHELAALAPSLSLINVGWVALIDAAQRRNASVRQLIRDCCFDYVTVPASDERIVDSIGHAYGMAVLNEVPEEEREGRPETGMVGACDAMRTLYRLIGKVAASDVSVFIAGESGTGKELTALAIHARSARRHKPFVAVNCGAIPAPLLQSELFGYEKGAFTGAHRRKIGTIEAANGGTLLLDEIGDLPLESQASLLRFLQEARIERLGGQTSIAVDVRIISATHVDMAGAMREGRFRPDLYYRLGVLHIEEPPLRARGKDIELLAQYTLDRFRKEAGRRLRGFSPDAIAAMHNYGWPGNVRELINRIRRAIVLSEGGQITANDLELGDYVTLAPVSIAQARVIAERQALELAMLRNRGRLSDIAHDLNVSRATLMRLMHAHGIHRGDASADLAQELERERRAFAR